MSTAEEKRAEAEKAKSGWPKKFTWRSIPFVIDDPEDWDLGTARAFELGHTLDALSRLIGPAAWGRIEGMSAREAKELFDKIARLTRLGDDAGE